MRGLALFLAIIALTLGCSPNDPASTERTSTDVDLGMLQVGTGFYPLALGNRWQLSRVMTLEYTIWGEPPGPVEVVKTTYDFEQICREDWFGVEYMIEEQRWQDDQGDSGTRWIHYRQDTTGLYEADVSVTQPPECTTPPRSTVVASRKSLADQAWSHLIERLPEASRATARAKSDEIRQRIEVAVGPSRAGWATTGGSELTRLRYPLTPGQSWYVWSDLLLAEVEAVEVLALPVGDVPAHRVRLTWVDFPDDLDIVFWWGRCGQLAYTVRFEFPVFDDTGRPIGTVLATEVEQVEDINLVDVRACTIAEER